MESSFSRHGAGALPPEPLGGNTPRGHLRWLRLGVATFAAIVAACGGGGTAGSGGGSAATGFTLGGTVTGLVGTGLTLNGGSAGQVTPANGAFTFPATLADGTGYATSVVAQPTNPRQTCTVGSGSGAVSGSNVSNLAVICTTDVASIAVTPSTASVEVGLTVTLQAQAFDSNGGALTGTGFAWNSSNAAVATVASGGTATGVTEGATNVTAAVGTVQSNAATLTVTASSGTSTQSSFEKIDAALAAGSIGAEAGLEYKVFAAFKDSRLPPQFQGNDSGIIDGGAVDLVYQSWDTLSDAAKATLNPFLMPPAYVGSWANLPSTGAARATALRLTPQATNLTCLLGPELDPNWKATTLLSGGHFKVWYDSRIAGANTQARFALNELETNIWPTIVNTAGMKEPLKDGSSPGCNGGDDLLDVYIVKTLAFFGLTQPVIPSTKTAPVFILVRSSLNDDELKGTLAHEFTHASQWAYPVAATFLYSYRWLQESTAQWAIDAVYSNLPVGSSQGGCTTIQFEQCKAPYFMEATQVPLESLDAGEGHMYGSYLFFQFLAKTYSPSLMGAIWAQTGSESDQVKVVDKAIPGGLHQQWPNFAKLLWNQDPVNVNSFDGWDALKLQPNLQGGGTITDVTMGGADHAAWVMNGNIKHLSTFYYQFRFSDPNVRSVIFQNHPYAAAGTPGGDQISTQAFFKKDGGIWQYENWSDEPGKEAYKSFCLDVKAERLTDLVIAMSNNDPSADVTGLFGALQPQLAVSSVGCWKYKGTTSVAQNFTSPTGTYTMAADATVTFVRYRPAAAPDGTPGMEVFQVDNGTVTGDSTQVTGGCTATQHGNDSIPTGVLGGTLQAWLGLDTGDPAMAKRTMAGFATAAIKSHIISSCPPGTAFDAPVAWQYVNIPTAAQFKVEIKPDGTIVGTYSRPAPAPATGSETDSWSLAPQREP